MGKNITSYKTYFKSFSAQISHRITVVLVRIRFSRLGEIILVRIAPTVALHHHLPPLHLLLHQVDRLSSGRCGCRRCRCGCHCGRWRGLHKWSYWSCTTSSKPTSNVRRLIKDAQYTGTIKSKWTVVWKAWRFHHSIFRWILEVFMVCMVNGSGVYYWKNHFYHYVAIN